MRDFGYHKLAERTWDILIPHWYAEHDAYKTVSIQIVGTVWNEQILMPVLTV